MEKVASLWLLEAKVSRRHDIEVQLDLPKALPKSAQEIN